MRRSLNAGFALFASATAFMLGQTGPASTTPSAVQINTGAGSQSCGRWVDARRSNDPEHITPMMLSWVQGYLVGYAWSATVERLAHEFAEGKIPAMTDEQQRAYVQKKFGTPSGWIFEPPDYAAVYIWMDNYCAAHPLERLLDATGELAKTLTPAPAAKPK